MGADDMMNQLIWCNYFLTEQGFKITKTVLYQDNQSAILLENNGKMSSGKRTRHINIRYFFITDRVKNQELEVEYCPTENMVADFFTKPLQGKQFFRFQNSIMGES